MYLHFKLHYLTDHAGWKQNNLIWNKIWLLVSDSAKYSGYERM
jgi:hypothetical protein